MSRIDYISSVIWILPPQKKKKNSPACQTSWEQNSLAQ